MGWRVIISPFLSSFSWTLPFVSLDVDDGIKREYVPVPIPVPVFIPMPMNMYSQVTPTPVSLPVPVRHDREHSMQIFLCVVSDYSPKSSVQVPVPVFLPTTLQGAEEIIESIKELKHVTSDLQPVTDKLKEDQKEGTVVPRRSPLLLRKSCRFSACLCH